MRKSFASTHTIPTRNARRALVTSALALTLAAGVVAGPVVAQDGTGAATPTPPSACEVLSAKASFGEDVAAATPMGTPSASPVTDLTGTPSAFPVVVSPTVDPLTQDLEVSATAIAGCLSDGNFGTLVSITGDLYRGQLLGFNDKLDVDDFTTLADTLPKAAYQIISVEDATFTDESSATGIVTYEVAHQVRKSTWDFSLQDVQGEQSWVLESETVMAPDVPANTATIEVTVKDNAFTLKDAKVSGPSVALSANNTDKVDHEMLVLRLDSGTTTKTLLQSPGPTLPKGVTFIGQMTVLAGGTGTLVLSGLQPGTYTMVDLLPNADGLPNLLNGMETTFTVE